MIKSYAGDIHKVYTGVCVVVPYKNEEDKAHITEILKRFERDSKEFFGVENLKAVNFTINKTKESADTAADVDKDDCSYGVITVSYSVYTDVHVVPMSDNEIRKYATSGEPLDKAGAYAIQGGFAPYISSIQGDYYNVVGLPACSLYALLKEL
ncbi:MAG: Maf family protein [Lachnospiraceae bacterium]|nr:Maf family protein [Lachnospiraceae bacterium]